MARAGWSDLRPSGGAWVEGLHKKCDMSWEYRGNQRYYYRRRKVGGQMVTEYIGNGAVADLIARQDEIDRQRRAAAAAEWQAMVDEDNELAETIAAAGDLVNALTAGVLLASGYHTHRRQWRKLAGKVTDGQS